MSNGKRRKPQSSAPTKRAAGRPAAPGIPVYIRAVGAPLSAAAKSEIKRKVDRKFGRQAVDVERASVRIEDVNGPRGGVDKLCRVKIVLSGLPSVVVEEQNESLHAAMDGALDRVQHAVRQALKRRRVEPRRSKAKTTA
jgi:ribosome-associated translation inhibitor RaiA